MLIIHAKFGTANLRMLQGSQSDFLNYAGNISGSVSRHMDGQWAPLFSIHEPAGLAPPKSKALKPESK